MNILFLGDVVGEPGRKAVRDRLPKLRQKHAVDFCVVNGENAAGGAGITPRIAEYLFAGGVDVLTLGDHTWDNREVYGIIDREPRLIRPANYPEGAPGKGLVVCSTQGGVKVAVLNLLGRQFFKFQPDCPFRKVDAMLKEIGSQAKVILIDFHAEATAEKIAFGRFVDGRASAVFGTHTHVATADAQVFPKGTAYITDAGMCGPHESVIGRCIEPIIQRMLTQLPQRYTMAEHDVRLNGALVEVDESTGKARSIRRICEVLEETRSPKSPAPATPEPAN
ncbi:MAG: TIGR00282 family metallophosphoesterase [Verrucomicrobiae bacterium]|nr:TIGR00282 family metallophosphoesterase [Verrucomicrobiae bacterium]